MKDNHYYCCTVVHSGLCASVAM